MHVGIEQVAKAVNEGHSADPGSWTRPRAAPLQTLLHRTEEAVQRQGLHGWVAVQEMADFSGGPAMADDNSPFGEGFANMPNDIHNTRVDTSENDDNETFVDLVRFGGGASTINRFLSTSTGTTSTERSVPRPPPAASVDARPCVAPSLFIIPFF
jgi:hypothetical protein